MRPSGPSRAERGRQRSDPQPREPDLGCAELLRGDYKRADYGNVILYRDALITEAVTGKLDVTRLSEQQMDESAHAAMEGEQPEVFSA
jgi:hypothetical protein